MNNAYLKAVTTATDTKSVKYQNDTEQIKLFLGRIFTEGHALAVRTANRNIIMDSNTTIQMMSKPFKRNTYVSISTIKDITKGRSASNVLQMRAITIDIDSHEYNLSKEQLVRAYEGMEHLGLYNYVPKPHFVSFTGRGLQITYVIDPVTMSKNKKYYTELYKDSVKVLQNAYSEALNEMSFIDCVSHLSVDTSVSSIAQLVRMPGTWNEKAKAQSQIISDYSDSEDISLSYIFEYKRVEVSKPKEVSVYKSGSYDNLHVARVNDMFKLLEIRSQYRTDYGHRQSMLANYLYCVLSLNEGISTHELEQKGVIYNEGFSVGLSRTEVISTATHIVKYKENNQRIGNDSMIRFLGITTEESEFMTTLGGTRLEKKRRLNMKETTKQNRNVTQLRSRAYTKVSNYNERIKLIELVRADFNNGMHRDELALKYGVTNRTINNYTNDEFCSKISVPTEQEFAWHKEESERLLIKKTKSKKH